MLGRGGERGVNWFDSPYHMGRYSVMSEQGLRKLFSNALYNICLAGCNICRILSQITAQLTEKIAFKDRNLRVTSKYV